MLYTLEQVKDHVLCLELDLHKDLDGSFLVGSITLRALGDGCFQEEDYFEVWGVCFKLFESEPDEEEGIYLYYFGPEN